MTTKRDLQKQGFKPIHGFEALYINVNGQVYDYRRKRLLSPRPKNHVAYNDKLLSVPKLLLSAYNKQPYNNRRQIRHINGDKTNIAVNNLCYTPDKSTLRINYADLYTAVRCYFRVPKRYKPADRARTRLYLSNISRRRGFMYGKNDSKALEIFGAYMDNPLTSLSSIADQYGIPVRLCTEMINPLINELIRDIIADHNAGKLHIIDYQPPHKTATQAIKEYNAHLEVFGIAPIKIPRKKSTAQILKDWDDHMKALEKECENRINSL